MSLDTPYAMSSTEPLESLYQRPGFLLRRAHQLSVGIFEEQCRELRLTPLQYGALFVLARAPELDQSALARALGIDRVNASHLLRGLEQRGLLERGLDPTDGRKRQLRLTPAGDDVLEAAHAPSSSAYERLLAPLSRYEQATLIALLGKLCTALEPEARTPMVPPTIR
ncbi:MAG: MarR family transcriptional regulator [Pigmentiphaga sp.]|nr:MarR family transcriptional regulator [Pigmentiphaga sp.]